jgi:hypothetical protein
MSNTHYSLLITHYFKIKDSFRRGLNPRDVNVFNARILLAQRQACGIALQASPCPLRVS